MGAHVRIVGEQSVATIAENPNLTSMANMNSIACELMCSIFPLFKNQNDTRYVENETIHPHCARHDADPKPDDSQNGSIRKKAGIRANTGVGKPIRT